MDRHSNSLFIKRVMAWFIDMLLLEALHLILTIYIAGKFLAATFAEPLMMLTFVLVFLFVFLTSFLLMHMAYFTLFHAWSGQTIGKMFMGIRVVAEDSKPASPPKAFLRWSGYILSFVPLATGFLWAAVDRDQCGWHDRLAGTRVISTEIT